MPPAPPIMPTPPVNIDDPKYLTELAFKNEIVRLSGLTVFITSDNEKRTHPCVTARVITSAEELAPGTGVYRMRFELELIQKLDKQTAEDSEQQLRTLRQCLYRNDNDPRPMRDLAIRLSKAVSQPYTCYGVVPVDEPTTGLDSETRLYTFKLAFDVHATPTR